MQMAAFAVVVRLWLPFHDGRPRNPEPLYNEPPYRTILVPRTGPVRSADRDRVERVDSVILLERSR